MSEFNKVTIGRGPHDEESLIKGLMRDFENAKNNPLSEDMIPFLKLNNTMSEERNVQIST